MPLLILLTLILGPAALIGAPFALPWKDKAARRRAWWALVMLAPPVFTVLWGDHFAVNPRGAMRNPAWVSDALGVALWTSVALPVVLAATIRRAWLFLALVGLAALSLEFWLSVSAGMLVTGIYP